jgi:hypothetical protein
MDKMFIDMVNDLENRWKIATSVAGHKNAKEITQKLEEIKALYVDTEIKEGDL